MQKVKLTVTQKKNFTNAANALTKAREQANLAQQFLNNTANQYDSIMEMIAEAHGIDFKSIDPSAPVSLDKEGYLIIGKETATARIKDALKKGDKNAKRK